MIYPDMNNLRSTLSKIADYGALAAEYGKTAEVKLETEKLEAALKHALAAIEKLAGEHETPGEPSDYAAIRKLCPGGNVPVKNIPNLRERMAGAVLGRFAGCTLGAPVEMWSINDMEAAAKYGGIDFPPTDYWPVVGRPWDLRYGVDANSKYSRDGMNGVP
ncbi:MAG: ADP-ribosylglycohydrolase family protein, partial [Firmicutes bacterium]|nr:ADP-ribosylglycohydrolase family protein [Bacillota bacterium]